MAEVSKVLNPDVLVVGAGPSGLSAAAALARDGVSVVVVDREPEAGGIPRHSDHAGYGIRDRRRVMTGPQYAARLVETAQAAGATLITEATVTDWCDDRAVHVTSPLGRIRVDAGAVVLATGARERPRSARMIPGDRPPGVFTTGQLQKLVHLHHKDLPGTAVVVGAELVSWSAVMTLREAGCKTTLMTTRYDQSEAYAAFRTPGRLALQVPVARRTIVTRIIGREKVTGVEIRHLDTGAVRVFPCDYVVLTGDWIPDNELARSAELDIDRATFGPAVDASFRTTRPGVFAIGNLVHPVEVADVCALDGQHVATPVHRFLAGDLPNRPRVPIVADEPFTWVSPQIFAADAGEPTRGRLVLWANGFARTPRIEAVQDGHAIGRVTVVWPLAPGRAFRVPAGLLRNANPTGGPVHIRLA